MTPAPVAVALDAPSLERAEQWALAAGPHVRAVKVGLELYVRYGFAGVRRVAGASGRPVFLDLKLHDIPHTVAAAARAVRAAAAEAGVADPAYLTVHAAGGPAMVAAAVEALPATTVVGVTVLTSLSEGDLATVGLAGPAPAAAVRLATVAVEAGARGIVCSPREVAAVRAAVGPKITLITPGVRPGGAERDDQSRVATPRAALAAGADLLVIGRPITSAADPGAAAAAIAAALHGTR